MKIIKYFNKEFVRNEKEKPVFEIKQLKYETTDKEFEKWYNYIKEVYGKYGDVTYIENGEDTKDREELQAEINARLLKDSANLQIELDRQRELNANLLVKIAQLGGHKNA